MKYENRLASQHLVLATALRNKQENGETPVAPFFMFLCYPDSFYAAGLGFWGSGDRGTDDDIWVQELEKVRISNC
jgi:hypothetical protein